MDIKDINRIALGEGEVLWVTLARGNLPYNIWQDRAKNVRDSLQLYFLTNRIIITPEDINIQAIREEINGTPTSI